MKLKASELIVNNDGSIYHLNLLPSQLADTVITVGDPDRVSKISRHFDKIEHKIHKREFYTHTGFYKGKRLSVISTGIGPDNIDIVLNELDALVNIDLEKRQVKKELKSLNIIRIGTTGAIQKEIPVDSFLISEKAVGFDGMLHFYESEAIQDNNFTEAFAKHLNWFNKKATPYLVQGDAELVKKMQDKKVHKGITATNIGFYGPQGRVLRIKLQDEEMNDKLASFSYKSSKITNLEMETAAIYGLSQLLGHKAVSMNAVIANRASRQFSNNPAELMEALIQYSLEKIIKI